MHRARAHCPKQVEVFDLLTIPSKLGKIEVQMLTSLCFVPRLVTDIPKNTNRIEPVVNEMLQILAHPDLSHQLVFVPIHASQLAHVSKDVL